MEHFTALLYIHSTNRCQLCYFKSDTCFIFLPILSTSTGICTDHTSIGSPLVSCVHTSYVPPAVFIVDNNCQLLTLCQLSTNSFYKYCVHLYHITGYFRSRNFRITHAKLNFEGFIFVQFQLQDNLSIRDLLPKSFIFEGVALFEIFENITPSKITRYMVLQTCQNKTYHLDMSDDVLKVM